MLCSTVNLGLLLRAAFLFTRSARFAVRHEFEVLFFNHVVASELTRGQVPVPDHRLHTLDSDSQPCGHLFSGKKIHA
jgi:hypothetical protein